MTALLTETRPSVEEAAVAFSGGFKIGAGMYRSVYHIPGSGWVYKILHNATSSSNEDEYASYVRLSEMKKRGEISFSVPETVLLSSGVIAQRFVEGEHPSDNCTMTYAGYTCDCAELYGFSECWYKATAILVDNHEMNVIITTDGDGGHDVYMIDLAY